MTDRLSNLFIVLIISQYICVSDHVVHLKLTQRDMSFISIKLGEKVVFQSVYTSLLGVDSGQGSMLCVLH